GTVAGNFIVCLVEDYWGQLVLGPNASGPIAGPFYCSLFNFFSSGVALDISKVATAAEKIPGFQPDRLFTAAPSP
ncbi:MAG: hypothetical protein ACSLE5_11950, partial [Porticoccaceae bacterium]